MQVQPEERRPKSLMAEQKQTDLQAAVERLNDQHIDKAHCRCGEPWPCPTRLVLDALAEAQQSSDEQSEANSYLHGKLEQAEARLAEAQTERDVMAPEFRERGQLLDYVAQELGLPDWSGIQHELIELEARLREAEGLLHQALDTHDGAWRVPARAFLARAKEIGVI